LRRHRQGLVVLLAGHAPHVATVGEDARLRAVFEGKWVGQTPQA